MSGKIEELKGLLLEAEQRGEPSAWMTAQGWVISVRGKKDIGEVDNYTIPLYR
jgi:hypothetical protein